MKNSLIYKVDTKNEFSEIKRLSSLLSRYTFNQGEKLKTGVVPNPRDGHSAIVYEGKMIVFGGDRNKFPFNDLFLYKLN